VTIHFHSDHDPDLSDYASTSGSAVWAAYGGKDGGPSLAATGSTGADAYATADLGLIASPLYVRARLNVQMGVACTVLRGRSAGGDLAFKLATSWPAAKRMTLTLWAYDDDGNSYQYDMTPGVDSLGLVWVEIMIASGASAGQVAGWIGGDQVLIASSFPPNSARLTQYLDAGAMDVSGSLKRIHVDALTAADAAIGSPAPSPVLIDSYTDKTRQVELWETSGEPSGGWQACATPSTGFVTERIEVVRSAYGPLALGDASGNVILDVGAGVGSWTRRSLIQAPMVRIGNIGGSATVRAAVVRHS
jgi:hypothetical protein